MTKIEYLAKDFSRTPLERAAWVRITTDGDEYVVPAAEYKSGESRLRQLVHPTAEDFVLDVLGAPFGGQFEGRDVHGQFFDENTNFHSDLLPLPPVFYYHGEATRHKAEGDADDHAASIGSTLSRWRDSSGEWFKVKLNAEHPKAGYLMEAARQGRLYASTGVIPAKHRVCDAESVRAGECGNEGHIRDWLIGELSLIDADADAGRFPANLYAMALPSLKCACTDSGRAEKIFGDSIELSENVTLAFERGQQPTQGAETMDKEKVGKFKAALMKLFKMFDDDGDEPTEKAADTEKPDAGVNPAHGDENGVIKCASGACGCGGQKADDGQKGALNTDAAQVAALQLQLKAMQAEKVAADDSAYMKGLVENGKLTPAEVGEQLKAFAAVRESGNAEKILPTMKAALEARPSRHQFTNPGGDLKLAGFSDPQQQGAANADYVARMKAFVASGHKEKGAKQNG